MTDVMTPEQRHHCMSQIKGQDTKPELAVRSCLHRLGYRFRLHDPRLPGRPDIVMRKHRTVVLVHGCYWHRHPGCKFAYSPKTRSDFWQAKFADNIERDRQVQRELEALGWNILVVWECQTRDATDLRRLLERTLPRTASAERGRHDER